MTINFFIKLSRNIFTALSGIEKLDIFHIQTVVIRIKVNTIYDAILPDKPPSKYFSVLEYYFSIYTT